MNTDQTSNGVKNLLADAKNICLIPSLKEPESIVASLALFYTLKELQKNVNLVIDELPEKLNFLVPSLDFLASPQNFVISIPKAVADVSQIYYEKGEESLKIHLTVNKGRVEKEKLSFYFQNAKPDLVITVGIQNFQKELASNLDAFGFLLDAPILNIDNQPENQKFGKLNIVEEQALSETVFNIIQFINESLVTKNVANCVLAGLMLYYENFKSQRVTSAAFELTAQLMKKGAAYATIIDNLKETTLNAKVQDVNVVAGEIINPILS